VPAANLPSVDADADGAPVATATADTAVDDDNEEPAPF
jgi:hypothetical protein